MFDLNLHDPALYGYLLLVLAAVAALITWLVLRNRKSPEEKERLRRLYLVQRGRIIDGTVLDLTDPIPPDNTRILQYQYEIAGVIYEGGQDVTRLLEQLTAHGDFLGMPASVRYDTRNPANSIVIAETWSGLRHKNEPPSRVHAVTLGKDTGASKTSAHK
jgi:hypothetical protein